MRICLLVKPISPKSWNTTERMNMNTILKISAMAVSMLAASFATTTASASENPVDEAGIQHNMYLGCLQSTGESADDSLVRLVEKCGFDPGMPLDEFVKTYQPVIEMDPTLLLSEKMSPYRERFSAYEFSFYERIDDVVMSAGDTKQADAMLAAIESEAIAKLDHKTDNGANILGTLSVARHSLRYWSAYSVARGDESATGNTASRMRWWKWLLVAAADAAGFALTEDIGTAASASETAYNWLN